MVQVTYPGVYIQEKSSGVHTITGVATSVAAFFGRAVKGPLDTPVRCFNYSDFLRSFEGSPPQSDLATSVRQFFDNGGTDCYVVRLAHDAKKAKMVLKNYSGQEVLEVTAKSAGLSGNNIQLEIDYNTQNPDETFNLRVFETVDGVDQSSESHTDLSMEPASARYAPTFVTQNSTLIDLAAGGVTPAAVDGFSQSRRPFDFSGGAIPADLSDPSSPTIEVSVDGSAFQKVTLSNLGGYAGSDPEDAAGHIATQFQAAISGKFPGAVTVTEELFGPANHYRFKITSAAGDKISVKVRKGTSGDDLAAPMMFGVEQGGIEITKYTNYRPVPTVTLIGNNMDGTTTVADYYANRPQKSSNSLSFTRNGDTETLSGIDLVTRAVDDAWYLEDNTTSNINGNNNGVKEKLKLLAGAVNDDAAFPYRAEVWHYYLAISQKEGSFNDEVSVTLGIGDPAVDVVAPNIVSNVKRYVLGELGASSYQVGATSNDNGSDGTAPELNDYLGTSKDQTGFHALDSVDIFNLMVLPNDEDVDIDSLWGPASNYCMSKRAFLIIDAPASWSSNGRPVATNVEINDLRNLVVKDYSAVFYPRVIYNDNGLQKPIGPSGMIAGLMARTDSTRGVWKAPAGTDADLRGVTDVEVNLTDPENGVYNQLALNCIRKFPVGFVNWGARTMDGADFIGSEWKYIPIRRLALFIEESLFRGTKWVVFEPNDEPLWAKIRLNVGAFMKRLFREGAFQGDTPDKAYYVKCDSETTTQSDRNLGIVNIQVGFAPLKPAEFVVITIQQIVGDL